MQASSRRRDVPWLRGLEKNCFREHGLRSPKTYYNIYIYIWYMTVALNSLSADGRSSRIKTVLSRIFREPHVYLSRACSYTIVLFRRTQAAWRSGRQPICKAMLGKFTRRVSLLTTFPWLGGARVLWGLLASMDTVYFAKTFAKNPLQINQKIHTLNRGWGFSSTWLLYSAWVYSLPANNKSEGSHFT